MSQSGGTSVIMPDTVIEGDIVGSGPLTIAGRVQGSVSAQSVKINRSGEIYGSLKAGSADVEGAVQGQVAIQGLIRIGPTGSVNGRVQYGRIAMESGASLDARLRNVPPHLGGDFQLEVDRGGSVKITTWDLTAFDPDDTAGSLTYTVTNPVNGYVAFAASPVTPISSFTQADLEAGRVVFTQDGGAAATASFDTTVTDASGATSGEPRRMSVSVKA